MLCRQTVVTKIELKLIEPNHRKIRIMSSHNFGCQKVEKKVKVGNDREKAQSERDSHSKIRGGKKTKAIFPIGGHQVT